MGKRWILGSIAIFFTRLHYRYEVKPYSQKKGRARENVREVVVVAVQMVFDEAWPPEARNDAP